MPDQIEQLKIVVTLNDQATPGINNFQKSIQSFTQGQGAQQVEAFKRQNTLMGQVLKATGLEATGAARSFETLGFRLLGTAGVIGVVGIALYKAASMANEAAKQIRNQAIAFERMGITYAEGKNIVEQYERVGMSIDEAQQNIDAGVQAAVEARRQGYSKMFDDLRHQLPREFVEQYRTALANSKTATEQLNTEAEYEQRIARIIEQNRGARTDAQVKEDTARLQHIFRQTQGFNEQFSLAKQISALDKEREASLNRMAERAKEFRDLWNEIAVDMQRIGDVLTSSAITAFTPLLQSIKGLMESIFEVMTKGHKALGDKNFWKGLLGDQLPTLPGSGGAGAPGFTPPGFVPNARPGPLGIMGAIGGAGDERLDSNTRELKKLNDNLYLMLHPQEGAIMMPGAGGGADGGAPATLDSSSTTAPATSASTAAPGNALGGNFFDAFTRGAKVGAFADGGIVDGPTLAMLGEKGPEAVVPLGKDAINPIPTDAQMIGAITGMSGIYNMLSGPWIGGGQYPNYPGMRSFFPATPQSSGPSQIAPGIWQPQRGTMQSYGDAILDWMGIRTAPSPLGAALRSRGTQRVQASGNITVDIGGPGNAPSPLALTEQLFKPVHGGKQLQMQPATVGPPELARQGPGGRY